MWLLYVLGGVVLVNCSYYILFSKFAFYKAKAAKSVEKYPISVLVCAKNEAENLKKHIPLYLQQDYPNFELILINDASSDDTLDVMESFQEGDSRIRVVDVVGNEQFWGSKKYALTLGIKAAKNKRMLFTDADCYPNSDHWVSEMAQHFSEEKHIILGYGGYEKKPGVLNALIRFETVMTAIQYFSYALANMPYMGVGRNLAYTSPVYYAVNGFMSHIKLPSGDDDLFVNEAATSDNTTICISEAAFTYSQPKITWKAWKIQKQRHISTATFYKAKHKFLLGLFYTSSILFWIIGLMSIILLPWEIPVLLIGCRFLLQFIILGKATKKLNEPQLLYFLPFLELFLLLTQLSIFISNRNRKPSRWK